jgi:hypothetical protein
MFSILTVSDLHEKTTSFVIELPAILMSLETSLEDSCMQLVYSR